MKHAFLIMAHDQFQTLKELVSVLDNGRNDIYIHFDKKVKALPVLNSEFSKLVILKDRVNVIWGDVSQIKAEYALYKEAFEEGKYDYYHLISGTHFPLKSNDDLDAWFQDKNGNSVMRQVELTAEEIQMRFGLYHFFLKHLVDKRRNVKKFYQAGWKATLGIQKKLGITRDTSFIKGKASQWCSLTEGAVKLLLSNEKEALKRFKRSFCCDEFFVLSILEGSGLPYLFDDKICYVEFVKTTPRRFKESDYQHLMATNALFFRKMTDTNLALAKKIKEGFTK